MLTLLSKEPHCFTKQHHFFLHQEVHCWVKFSGGYQEIEMGCAVSKQDQEDDVVSLCRERKRLLKLAVERRYAFADAQCKYNQALYTVAMALRLFVSRHSSPASPFRITFPSGSDGLIDHKETLITNSMFLQQRPTEHTHESIACQVSGSKSLASSPLAKQEQESQEHNDHDDGDEDEESDEESESEYGEVCQHFYGNDDEEGAACEHFYGEMGGGLPIPSPGKQFGWDFFDPFGDVRTEVLNGFSQSSDDDLRAVREKEGIPELEEGGERRKNESEVVAVTSGNVGQKKKGLTDVKNGNEGKVGLEEIKGLKVVDTPTNGRELLEALKDVEDHFIRVYDSGLEISRMLEANRVQLLSGSEEIKQSSNKLIRSFTRSRSISSRSSSCKSLLTSSSVSSSMWTEFKNDIIDDYGMEAGSHSLTLGRLYAWEKKLYEEVKDGDQSRKLFERKCSHLRNKVVIRDGVQSTDKSRAEVKDLHAKISVAIRSAESISDRIQKVIDEELQPQLLELLHGLMRNWKIMLESHETQKRVMLEVKSFNCPTYGKFCNNSHHLATLQLEAELDNWRHCFASYVSTQKEYIEALTSWLYKFIAPQDETYSCDKFPITASRIFDGPPLLVTCCDWLSCLEKLPNKSVTGAMKSLGKDIRALQSQQGEEQQQKRKVDGLAKELDRRTLAFQRAERRFLESKISEQQRDMSGDLENLSERKNLLDIFRKRLETEQEKYLGSMQETRRIAIHGFQAGFSSVFESLVEFAKASVKIYADLVTYSANAKAADKDSNLSYIEERGSQVSC